MVAAAIEPQLMRKEGERGIQRPESLTAWDLVRRGMWHFHKFTPDNHAKAAVFFLQATLAEPTEASGHIWLARAEGSRLSLWGTSDREKSLSVAVHAARKGIELDPENPYAHHAVAAVCVGNGEFEQSLRAAEHAISLSPDSPSDTANVVRPCCNVADLEVACHLQFERGLRLSPYDPQNFFWLLMLGWCFYLTDQQTKALAAVRSFAFIPTRSRTSTRA